MILGNERLIVVLGMAHSGTTILTHLLSQHPAVSLGTGGNEAWLLENDWLPTEQSEPIQALLEQNPHKRVLLKRPWNSAFHGDWMRRDMPEARFVYIYKTFDEMSCSWSKPTSLVPALREGGMEKQLEFYQMCWENSMQFGNWVERFFMLHHATLVNDPLKIMSNLNRWLELPPFRYNLSDVSQAWNIKDRMVEKLIKNTCAIV